MVYHYDFVILRISLSIQLQFDRVRRDYLQIAEREKRLSYCIANKNVHLLAWAISGMRGSDGLGSVNKELIESSTFEEAK